MDIRWTAADVDWAGMHELVDLQLDVILADRLR
jgi:hypothetical protein